MAVFWVVALCVYIYQCFRDPYCHHHRGIELLIALMIEAVRTSEMLVNLYQCTWRYNPEDSHLHAPLTLGISLSV
jgi:hypothetical protein